MKYRFEVIISLFFISIYAHAAVEGSLTEAYLLEKEKVATTDEQSRKVMSALYQINQRMKNISKRRDILNNKVLGAEANVRALAKDTAALELKIKEQRSQLSKRLKAIYMLGDEGVVRVIFSSASAQDLNETLKYLKLISDHDYKLIKAHERNLRLLQVKNSLLTAEVRQLLQLKNKFQIQENKLSSDQGIKSKILGDLKSQKSNSMGQLTKLRALAKRSGQSGLFDLSFYEQKGKLPPPVDGTLEQAYGIMESPDFRYRLSHKGNLYKLHSDTAVQSVFAGTVSYVGSIEGYGMTVVIDHGDHYYSVYSSVLQPNVAEGQEVLASEKIAKANGEMYFEIRHFSDAIDPLNWLIGHKI